jgi:glycosyltransferase involved in cell wall biosynthesis
MEPRHGACRIGVLINSSFWSGMEVHTVELVGLLAGRGHEVTIAELGKPVIAESGRLPTALGVRLLQANPGLQLNQVGLRHWLRYIRGLQTDVVVFVKGSTDDGSVRLDLAARLCCRRFMTIEQMTPPPRPVYSRGSHLGGLLPGLGLWWYRQMAPVYLRSLGPKRIVGVSHAVARELRAYGFPGRKLAAVPHGVDAERYQRSPAHRAAMRATWDVPPDALLFGSVGRLDTYHKGQDIALELLARLRERNPGLRFRYVLVGKGPHRARLEQQSIELGLAEHVIFAGHTDRPWEAHSAIDVFLMPSRFEGIGLALEEAMASECCPIAMGVGGVADVISEPSVGWAVPPGDREAFLSAMQAVLDLGAAGRAAMGTRARRHIMEHFRADEQYAALADLIEGL